MKFEINGREWRIKEVEQEVFWEDDGEDYKEKKKDGGYYFGRTKFATEEIWLCKDLSDGQRRKTLIHELVHCYRGSYIGFNTIDGGDEELWCDIISNSHDIIEEIVSSYERVRDIAVEEWE